MFINGWVDKEYVVYLHIRILFLHLKNETMKLAGKWMDQERKYHLNESSQI